MSDEIESHTQVLNELHEMFAEIPVPHGMWFDDNRRWCSGCERPQHMQSPLTNGNMWADKTCPLCSAVWPEFAMEVIEGLVMDDDFIDQFPEIAVH